jgi:hypothetical protein
MTRDDIAAVLARYPSLNPEGLGFPRGLRPTDPAGREEWLARQRATLLGDWHADACTRAESWLMERTKIRTPRLSSYWLKHRAEEEVGYITNGDLIVAAIHLGFPIKGSPDSINPLVGVSSKFMRGRADALARRHRIGVVGHALEERHHLGGDAHAEGRRALLAELMNLRGTGRVELDLSLSAEVLA